MKSVLNLGIAFLLGLSGVAKADDLSVHLWERRPVLVFADDPEDQTYYRQMKMLSVDFSALRERDIVVYGDNLPEQNGSLRKRFKPESFTFILIGKDGGVKYRSETPVSSARLFEIIDAMPMRQREMREQN